MKKTSVIRSFRFSIVFFLFSMGTVSAQSFDILIKGGHVLDIKNGIDKIMDVAIKEGKIAKIDAEIQANQAVTLVDAKGLYVTPGLIDIHSHNFYGTQTDTYLSDCSIVYDLNGLASEEWAE